MTDNSSAKAVLSICATTSDKVKDLVIKNGQLIFVHDTCRIAFDYKGKRTFYNQITELDTEQERNSLSSPAVGYYFVIETAILWYYQDAWLQITTPPEETVFIGVELPELGKSKSLYVNKISKEISVWDEDSESYIVVADKTDVNVEISVEDITEEEISALF